MSMKLRQFLPHTNNKGNIHMASAPESLIIQHDTKTEGRGDSMSGGSLCYAGCPQATPDLSTDLHRSCSSTTTEWYAGNPVLSRESCECHLEAPPISEGQSSPPATPHQLYPCPVGEPTCRTQVRQWSSCGPRQLWRSSGRWAPLEPLPYHVLPSFNPS
jgi:hypothetical protein